MSNLYNFARGQKHLPQRVVSSRTCHQAIIDASKSNALKRWQCHRILGNQIANLCSQRSFDIYVPEFVVAYMNKPRRDTRIRARIGVYIGVGSGISMSGASERQEQLGDVMHDILVMPRTPGLEGQYLVGEDDQAALQFWD